MIATGFEFGKLGRHLGSYLAPLVTYFGNTPPVESITAFVRDHYAKRPPGVSQQFSPADLCLLEYVIQNLKPIKVIEIGVASGFTTSYILNSLQRNITDQSWTLESYDIAEYCSAGSQNNRTGFCVERLAPDLMNHWTLNIGCTSLDIAGKHKNLEGAVLSIVDACHFHPWPLIDVLNLSKVIPTGSWIMLQDIDHCRRMMGDAFRLGSEPVDGNYGPALVYEYWPGRKVKGIGGCFNVGLIGSIEYAKAVRRCRHTMRYTFETKLERQPERFLNAVFKEAAHD